MSVAFVQDAAHASVVVRRMNTLKLITTVCVTTALLGGCLRTARMPKKPELGPEAAQNKERYAAEVRDIDAEKRATEWREECTGEGQARCGLVFDEINEPAFTKRFVDEVCEEDVELLEESSASCRSRFRKMFLARLAERYFEVTPAALASRCDAYPEKCKNPRKVERWMLKEHNAVVVERHRVRSLEARDHYSDTMRASITKAEVEEKQKDEQARRELGQALDDLLGPTEPPPPDETCVTEKVGAGVEETNCYKRKE